MEVPGLEICDTIQRQNTLDRSTESIGEITHVNDETGLTLTSQFLFGSEAEASQ